MNKRQLDFILKYCPIKKIKEKIKYKYDVKFINDVFNYEHKTRYIDKWNDEISFNGKIILDVGGGNISSDYMKFLGVNKFICVDDVDGYYGGIDNYKKMGKEVVSINDSINAFNEKYSFVINGYISKLPDFFNEKFDIIYAINSFEHINDLEESLNIIYNLLKPGGHFFYNLEYFFGTMRDDIGFIHLLYSKEEAKKVIKNIITFEKYGDLYKELQEKFIYQVYESNIINRLMLDEHIKIYTNSQFNKHKIEYDNRDIRNTDNKTLEILKNKYGNIRYDVGCLIYHGVK